MQTLRDLTDQMTEFLDGDSGKTYSERHKINKLREQFGDDVIINGKANVVTMRHSADNLLLDCQGNQSNDSATERRWIIEAASKLIREDIKAMATNYLALPMYIWIW